MLRVLSLTHIKMSERDSKPRRWLPLSTPGQRSMELTQVLLHTSLPTLSRTHLQPTF